MKEKTIVMLLFGVTCVVIGFLMSTNARVAEWGLNQRRARLWLSLLGKERANKATKFFFGPLAMLIGIIAILGVLLSPDR